jgi:two-component system, NtrC family, sensor kinase
MDMKNLLLFKKLDLNLRVEIIINISVLMLAAILLIGFTISRFNEKNILNEKIKNGEQMIKDFQSVVDFIFRDRKEAPPVHPFSENEIKDFIRIYMKDHGFYDFIIVDHEFMIVASKRIEMIGKQHINDFMKASIQSGQFNTEIVKSGSLLSPSYEKITLFSPLWNRGGVVGGIQMEVPIADTMTHLLESQRMILISVLLDAIVLIIFGSFLLSRALVKPLKELARLTQKVSEGDFDQKIEVTTKNEIGQLVSSFNRMTERLKEKQENIEVYLESLQSTNQKLKQAQEELIRTEKLASIGRFASGVAHEIGNPLGVILGYNSILEQGGIHQEEAQDYLNRIKKEIGRINRIVRELLDFARPSKFEVRAIAINKVIENALSLLSYQKKTKDIETKLDLSPDLPTIQGDESQLSQVFMNIILNGIDAMPDGGILAICTAERAGHPLQEASTPRDGEKRIFPAPSYLQKPSESIVLPHQLSHKDRWIRIRIADTGIGIKREDLEKIFDPFFTTKEPNEGVGLGLSISIRIVESMGGNIMVESELGKGATFEVHLPVGRI